MPGKHGICVFNVNCSVTYINRAAEEIVRWAPGQALGRDVHDVFPFVGASQPVGPLVHSSDGNGLGGESHETSFERHDGTCARVSYTWAPMAGGGGVLALREATGAESVTEELVESERQSRLLFEQNPFPMWVYDVQSMQFLDVNPAAVNHYGYSREEFLSMTLKDIRPSEDVPALLDGVRRNAGAFHAKGRWRHKRKDGRIILVDVTSTATTYQQRAAKLAVIHDVTDREESEAKVREATARIDAVMNTVPLAIWGVDLAGKVNFWNRRAERLFGWKESEVVGSHLPCAPEERSALFDALPQVQSDGDVLAGVEQQLVCKDGNFLYCEVWDAALRDGNGETIGTIAVAADTTERRRYRESLVESEQKFRTLFADNPQPMLVFDSESFRFLEINEAAVQHYGYSREEFLAMTLFDLRPAGTASDLVDALRGSGDLQEAGECQHRLKDGRIIAVNIAVHRLDLFGRPAVLALIHDVTDRKRAEEQLGMYIRSLARSNDDLKQFAYAASHDLQEPLRNVRLFTELLAQVEREDGDGRIAEYLGHVLDGAKQIQNLVHGLRRYWELGEMPFAGTAPVDGSEVLQSVLAGLRPDLKAAGAAVRCDKLPSLAGNEHELRTVLEELLKNAIRFRSQQALCIDISARPLEPRTTATNQSVSYIESVWEIAMRDNGIGIAPAYSTKIFGIFKRLSRSYEGIGLGLAVVKRIVERRGGRIWVQSEEGQGSTFHFTWPAA